MHVCTSSRTYIHTHSSTDSLVDVQHTPTSVNLIDYAMCMQDDMGSAANTATPPHAIVSAAEGAEQGTSAASAASSLVQKVLHSGGNGSAGDPWQCEEDVPQVWMVVWMSHTDCRHHVLLNTPTGCAQGPPHTWHS